MEGDKNLFNIWLQILGCWVNVRSISYLELACLHFPARFWTIFTNALVSCSILAFWKHWKTRPKLASDWNVYYERILKAFLTVLHICWRHLQKDSCFHGGIIYLCLSRIDVFVMKYQLKSLSRKRLSVNDKPFNISKCRIWKLIQHENF